MKPKIIVFDLETLPNLREALKHWTQLSSFPGRTLKANVSTIICCGWKYLHDKKTQCINAWDFKNWKNDVNDDSAVCEAIYEVLKEADAVVTQNGKRFDWKHLQTRLMANNLPPLPKIKHIDTRQLAASNLYLVNNSLNTLGDFLVGDKKLENGGWELWRDVHADKDRAKKIMEKYCKQDVNLLEKVFLKLLPFCNGANGLPNFNLFRSDKQMLNNEMVCPNCGVDDYVKNGFHYLTSGTYQKYSCKNCFTTFKVLQNGKIPRV